MNHLKLDYDQDDPPNAMGGLDIFLEAHEVRGAAWSYTSEADLQSFADAVSAYPLIEPHPRLTMLDIEIGLAPLDSLGHLRVTVELSATKGPDQLEQHARLQFDTDYASAATFSKAQRAVISNGSGTATLIGI